MRNSLLCRPRRILALLLFFCMTLVGALARAAEQGEDASLSTPDGFLLEVKTSKAQVYVREPIPLTVTLLTGALTVRNIEYPRLKSSVFSLREFDPPCERIVVRGGRHYNSYEFTTTLTPKQSGTLLLGPAELRCELLAPSDSPAAFFGDTEARSVTVRSAAIPMTVLPLPVKGRPAGFTGAVGRFTVAMTASPTAVQAGDPVTVRTVIGGAGNIDAFSCKSIAIPGLRSYPPHSSITGNIFTCEQVVIPESPAVREIPAVSVSFFDLETKQYRTASSGPLALRVSAIPILVPPTAPWIVKPGIPFDPPSPLAFTIPAAIVAILLLATVVTGIVLLRRRQLSPLSVSADTGPALAIRHYLAEAEAALAAGEGYIFYTSVFRALQLSVGEHLDLPPSSITSLLPQWNLPVEVSMDACLMLDRCDQVRYGKQSPDHDEMSTNLFELLEIINYFSRLENPTRTTLRP